jgi:PAS domain-containing protein
MSRILFKMSQKERATVENVRDVICSLNAKGTFDEVSAAAEQVFGYTGAASGRSEKRASSMMMGMNRQGRIF